MKVTPEIVRELLHYDPDTGVFTWRERDRHWFKSHKGWRSWNGKHAGKRAGSLWTNAYGYKGRKIQIIGCPRKEHHLAWLYMTDEPVPEQIDHENRDGTDSRWLNLRASTHQRNGLNQSMRRDNASGVVGVSWFKKTGKWRARCTVSGKIHHLGHFHDLEEAGRVVKAFRAAHGFDPGHGKELAHYHAT